MTGSFNIIRTLKVFIFSKSPQQLNWVTEKIWPFKLKNLGRKLKYTLPVIPTSSSLWNCLLINKCTYPVNDIISRNISVRAKYYSFCNDITVISTDPYRSLTRNLELMKLRGSPENPSQMLHKNESILITKSFGKFN